ncbi:MAG TPA: GspH/FimT family protein [Bdellovibrionota bacterium]|nr:GspH/FimT family protein [Bdellovibrionota bacterium]
MLECEGRVQMDRITKISLGMSLIEIIIVMVIVAALASVFIITMLGSKSGDSVDRATQAIHDDIVLIRSRAISTNRVHRISFSSSSDWTVGANITGTANWEQVGDVNRMPVDTYLDNATWTTALGTGAKWLESTPRGLFQFSSGAIPAPYVIVTGLGATRTKTITVDVGGAISIENH